MRLLFFKKQFHQRVLCQKQAAASGNDNQAQYVFSHITFVEASVTMRGFIWMFA